MIENPKYKKNKKNGGKIPELKDNRVLYVPIGCGKCMECLKQKGREWNVRLQEELRNTSPGSAFFVTLTFSNKSLSEIEEKLWIKVKHSVRKEIIMKNGKKRQYYNYMEVKNPHELTGYDLDNAIAKKATRLFLENWRKKHGKSLKHWFVTELGTKNTERIHIHGIVFMNKKEDIKDVKSIWKYGNTWIGTYVNESTMSYITKYLSKPDSKHKYYKPIILTSSGIGKTYLERSDVNNNKFKGKDTNESYRTRTGHRLSLPIYYRNYIYTEEQREQLWINKLDEKIRYVNGIKIDVSNGEEHYYNKLDMVRILNHEQGFGNNEINWKKRNYENWLRKLKHHEQKIFER